MLSQIGLAVLFVVSASQFKPETMSPEFQGADAELNAVYKEMMAAIPEEARERLKAAQLAWIPYRDLASELEADLAAGSGNGPAAFDASMTYLTRKQVQWLQLVYSGDWEGTVIGGHSARAENWVSDLDGCEKSLCSTYDKVAQGRDSDTQLKLKAFQGAWLFYRRRMNDLQEACCKEPERALTYADALRALLVDDQRNHLKALLVTWDLEAIRRGLKDSQSLSDERRDIFGALVRRGKAAVPLLVELIKGDSVELQAKAIETLADIGVDAADALPVLRQVLARELAGEFAADEVPAALGQMGSVGLPVLLESLRSHKGGDVRRIAQGFKGLGPMAVPVLMKEYETADAKLQSRIASTMGFIGPAARDAVPMLISSLKKADISLQTAIAKSLARIGEPADAIRAALMQLLREQGVYADTEVINALAQLRPVTGDVITALKETALLQEPAGRCAATALCQMKSDEGTAALVELAANSDAHVRARIVALLGRLAPEHVSAAEALSVALSDPDEHVREEAAKALGETPEAVLARQLKMIEDPEFSFVKAGNAEWKYTGIKAIESLHALLKSDDPEIRAKAALVGSAIERWDGAGIPELVAKLSSADRDEVISAIRGLAAMGAQARQAVKPLQAFLNHDDEALAEEAKHALERMGPEVEGVDYRLEMKPAGASDVNLYDWMLHIDGQVFRLAPLEYRDGFTSDSRYGFDVHSVEMRWVAPGRFLEVFWETCPQGSGLYIAYSTLLLEKTESGWREIFRHSGDGYANGGPGIGREKKNVFVYDAKTGTLSLRRTVWVESKNDMIEIVEWPCELVEGGLKCLTGKQYLEDVERLRKLNPDWETSGAFSSRLVLKDDVPAFKPCTDDRFQGGDPTG